MKTNLLPILALLALSAGCFADDFAVMLIKMPGDKKLKRVEIEFYENDAPDTVANFKKLASHNFYKG
ncbi:MAG: peptidylprolyl isomerase, partial [Verrucomicrobiota bacterium]|nr:peptidylprolyl isomerase [Verrucomicrobiota bacterium]